MRRRRHIDMLPLLDVFMVVVFLFATIQEGTAKQIEQTADTREKENAKKLAAAEAERDAAVAERERVSDAHRILREQIASARAKTPAVAEPRVAIVLDRLLEKASVVEVEIVGTVDAAGDIRHACCFRTDPRTKEFKTCGEPPRDATEMERWLETDARALSRALRATGGGAALTLIRQDPIAAYRISSRLGDTIRRLYPDRQVFAETPRAFVAACATDRPPPNPR